MRRRHPLRILRENACLSQRDLAEKSSISMRTITTVEQGKCQPMIRTRRKLLMALNAPITDHFAIFGPFPDQTTRKEEVPHADQ